MHSCACHFSAFTKLACLTLLAAVLGAAQAQSSNGQSQRPQQSAPDKIDPAYRDVANGTGGQVFALSPSELANNPGILKFMGGFNAADILGIADRLVGTAKTYPFPVDSTVRSLTVSVSGTAEVVLRRPDGTPVLAGERDVEVVSLSKMAAFSVDRPDVGDWNITAGGSGEFTVFVRAKSNLDLISFEFVERRGRPGHEGFFEIAGFPLAGFEAFARATVSGPFQTARFELRSLQGTVLQSVQLPRSGDDEFLGALTPSDKPFRVYVTGRDTNGHNYQRLRGALIAPQPFRVRLTSQQRELWAGDKAGYTFEVENHGPADRFEVTAVYGSDVVHAVDPSAFRLGSNEMIEGRMEMQVPWSARPGSSSALIVTVQSSKTGGYNSAIVDIRVRR